MRLIDKDLVLKTSKDKEWGLWCEIANIKFAPEVEAIPIEWINKYIDSTLDEGNSQMLGFKAAIIKEMIEEWEKENEI